MFQKKNPIYFLLLVMLFSCSSKKVEVVEPADADKDIATLNSNFLKDSSKNFKPAAGAPSVWQSFELFFKSCVASSSFPEKSLFSKYRLLYLGPSNPSYLGTVFSKDGVQPKTELTRWLSQEELNKFIVKGVQVPSCDIESIKETFISIALGNLTDPTLKFVLENKDSIRNSVGSWSIDYILTSDFIKYLNDSSSNDNVRYYRDVMTSGNNVVAFKVVKVKGFKADITSKRDITIDVDLNIPIMSIKTNLGNDSVVCSLKLKKTNNRTVSISSDGDFNAFALVMKGRKIGF